MRDIQIQILRVVRDELARSGGYIEWRGHRYAPTYGIESASSNGGVKAEYPSTIRGELAELCDRGLVRRPDPMPLNPEWGGRAPFGFETPEAYRLTPQGYVALDREAAVPHVAEAPEQAPEPEAEYQTADYINMLYGIRASRLSEAASAGRVHKQVAPQGRKNSQDRPVRVLYNVADVRRVFHCEDP